MINTTMKLIIFTINIFLLITSLVVAKPIDELIIKGNERISSETIKVFSGFNKGDDANQNDLNDIIKSLYETNFFENVTIEIVNNNLIVHFKITKSAIKVYQKIKNSAGFEQLIELHRFQPVLVNAFA